MYLAGLMMYAHARHLTFIFIVVFANSNAICGKGFAQQQKQSLRTNFVVHYTANTASAVMA